MTTTTLTREQKLRQKLRDGLDAYFDRRWEDSRLGLPREVYARFKRFEEVIYSDPESAVRVAREDVADLAIKDDGEPLFSEIRKLVRADNPARACKLYVSVMSQWTKDNTEKVGRWFTNVGLTVLLVFFGLMVAVVAALYKVLFLL